MSNENVGRDSGQDPQTIEEQLTAASVKIETLRAEVEELQRYKAKAESRIRFPWRRVVVAVLIVLGCVIGAGANVTVWLKSVALNTNAWVATVGPLSRDPAVALAISDYAVGQLFASVDAEQRVRQALPPNAAFLAPPLVSATQDYARDVTADVINSERFSAIWSAANRFAHEQAVALLRNKGGLFYISSGQVTVDLNDLLVSVQDTLDSTGLGAVFGDLPLSEGRGKWVVYEGARLAQLQQALTILDRAGVLLPLLSLAAFALAVWASLWRRRTLLYIGIGLAITMGLSLFAFRLARSDVLNQIANELYRSAAEAMWGIVLTGLVRQTVLVLLTGLIIAVGAFLAGPHPWAMAARTSVRDFMGNSAGEKQGDTK
jgi:hypothetical protein